MKLNLQEDSSFKSIEGKFRKGGSKVNARGQSIPGAGNSRTPGEAAFRDLLTPQERREWDKLPQRKRDRLLEKWGLSGEAMGEGPAEAEEAANLEGGKAAAGKGRRISAAGITIGRRGRTPGEQGIKRRANAKLNSMDGTPAQPGTGRGVARPSGGRPAIEGGSPQAAAKKAAESRAGQGKGSTSVSSVAKGGIAIAGGVAGATARAAQKEQERHGDGEAAPPSGSKAGYARRAGRAADKFRAQRNARKAQEAKAAAGKAGAAAKSGTAASSAASAAAAGAKAAGAKLAAALSSVFAALASVFAQILPAICIAAIIAALVTSLISWLDGETAPQNGSSIVEVAMQELEDREDNIGGYKYKNWMGLQDNWCAMFVSWCADQCGYVEAGVVPKTASVSDMHYQYEALELYYDNDGDFVPQAGDFIFYEGPGDSHMGIVVSYDYASGIVTTIEGNTGSGDHTTSQVNERQYLLSNQRITGFARPDYPSGVDSLSGGSNTEKIYRAFVDAGYTAEAAAAVCGNLAAEAGTDASGDIVIDSTENNGEGEGIGICQWSYGRKTSFMAWAEQQGEPWPDTSLLLQINYMMLELSSNQWLWSTIGQEYGSQYNISHAEFKASTDVALATGAFCANFERCHYADSHLESMRVPYAQEVLAAYGGYVAGSGSLENETETETEE